MLKVYSFNNSICAQKVFIALDEKRLAFDTQNVNLFANEQFKPEYLRINPNGVVPALDHDGAVVIESSLICEYLDETFPEPRLSPATPLARARMRLWSKIVDEYLFEATRELSFSAMFRERMKTMSEAQREGRFRNVGDPVKRARLMSTFEDGVESPYVYEGIGWFEKAFAKMEQDLAAGGPWLVGAKFTLADVNMIPFLARLENLGLLDIWIADRPLSRDWWRRARARPSFAVAIDGKVSDGERADMLKFGVAIRERVAARRAEYLRQPKATA